MFGHIQIQSRRTSVFVLSVLLWAIQLVAGDNAVSASTQRGDHASSTSHRPTKPSHSGHDDQSDDGILSKSEITIVITMASVLGVVLLVAVIVVGFRPFGGSRGGRKGAGKGLDRNQEGRYDDEIDQMYV